MADRRVKIEPLWRKVDRHQRLNISVELRQSDPNVATLLLLKTSDELKALLLPAQIMAIPLLRMPDGAYYVPRTFFVQVRDALVGFVCASMTGR
eukprot:SAG31_NODE_3079_length_4706_cov_3.887779_6_plen_94_part_00